MGTPHGGADTRQNATGSQRGPVQSKQQQEAPRPLLLGSRRGRVSLLWGSRIRPRLTVGLSHSGCSPGQRQDDGAECEPWLATLLQARPAPTTRGRQKVAVSLEPFWGERGGRHPQAWTRALLPEMRGWQPVGLVLWSEGEWGSPGALGSEVPSDSTGARRNHTKLPRACQPGDKEAGTRRLRRTDCLGSVRSLHAWMGCQGPPSSGGAGSSARAGHTVTRAHTWSRTWTRWSCICPPPCEARPPPSAVLCSPSPGRPPGW